MQRRLTFPGRVQMRLQNFLSSAGNDRHMVPSAKANLASSSPPYIQQDLVFHPCPNYTFSALLVFLQEHRGAWSSKNISQVSAKTQDLKVVGREARIKCEVQTEELQLHCVQRALWPLGLIYRATSRKTEVW